MKFYFFSSYSLLSCFSVINGQILELKVSKETFDISNIMILSKVVPLASLVVKNGTKNLFSLKKEEKKKKKKWDPDQ